MNKEKIKEEKQICNIFINSSYYISIAIDKKKIPLIVINSKK